jgi:transcriptional regulator with XRE-family HTH domain
VQHPTTTRETFRLARLAKGWSCREAARQAGFAPSYVTKFEHGAFVPSVESLHRLATVLGLDEVAASLAWLLDEAVAS